METAFSKKYPNATDVFWVAEFEEYVASFENVEFESIMVTFNEQGDWLQTDISLSVEALPMPAQDISILYPGRDFSWPRL